MLDRPSAMAHKSSKKFIQIPNFFKSSSAWILIAGSTPTNNLGFMLRVNESGATVGNTYPSFAAFLNLLVPVAFVFAGIILLFLLIGGGFAIISSGGNAKSVESGKNQIMGAIIGFVIIFASFWIIQIIQAITGVRIIDSGL